MSRQSAHHVSYTTFLLLQLWWRFFPVAALVWHSRHPLLPQSFPPHGLLLVSMLVKLFPTLSTILSLYPVTFSIFSSFSLKVLARPLCSVCGTKITAFTRLFLLVAYSLYSSILSSTCSPSFLFLVPFLSLLPSVLSKFTVHKQHKHYKSHNLI